MNNLERRANLSRLFSGAMHGNRSENECSKARIWGELARSGRKATVGELYESGQSWVVKIKTLKGSNEA